MEKYFKIYKNTSLHVTFPMKIFFHQGTKKQTEYYVLCKLCDLFSVYQNVKNKGEDQQSINTSKPLRIIFWGETRTH